MPNDALPRTTPVSLIEHQGRRWLVAPYGEVSWVRNVRAAVELELRRGGTAERCLAREAAAGEAVRPARLLATR